MEPLSHNPLRVFYRLSKHTWPQAIISIAAVVVGSSLNIYLLVIIKQFTDAVVEHRPAAIVWQLGLMYPVILFFHTISWRVSGFAGMKWFEDVRQRSYSTLYDHILHHDKTYFSDRFAGTLLSKVNNAVEGMQHIIQRALWEFLPILLNTIFTLYIAYYENWLLSAVMLLWVLVFFGSNMYFVQRYLAKTSYISAQSRSDLSGAIVDSLSNISSVHAFAGWEHENRHANRAIDRFKRATLTSWTVSENMRGFNGGMMVISSAALILLSLRFFFAGQISLGSVLLIVGMGKNLGDLMWNFSSELRNTVTDYGSACEGLDEILQPYGIISSPNASELKLANGVIRLENITFSYGGANVLKRVFFDFRPGERVGLVGRSGAGKSTLVSLLLRDFDPQEGRIMIDNQDISGVTLQSLREQIGYVPQDTSLFHRSLYENILYARPGASKSEVIAATKAAHAHEFIESLPQKYDTLVGERGIKLSGGQRQRIAIARAFLKNAPILILDEATSSLDSESELAIQKSLTTLMKGKTVIAIAHRLSTLREMDRIIVLEDGEVKEDGSPVQLLKNKKSLFKILWDHQVSGFIPEEE